MRTDLTYCDFLVLAPLKLEVDALQRALEDAGWKVVAVEPYDFTRVLEATFRDQTVSYFERHVTIVQLTHQGVLNASVDTARALELYEPGYVVSFGIAGTFKEKEAPIGTAVFATSLLYYEPAKDELGTTQSRMAVIPIENGLLNHFRQIGDSLSDVVTNEGNVASGEKLFADTASNDRGRIQGVTDKTLAVEMEAAGVGQAVSRLCPSAKFVVIKGISDPASEKKSSVSDGTQNRHRTGAAYNAARCLARLMHAAPLRRISRSEPRPSEANWHQIARREATEIIYQLKPYGITTDDSQLFQCLYGRRGRPIPAYYHWRQKSEALHWIDFKILTALATLPRGIVTPIPLVTINMDDGVHTEQLWHSSVYQLLGVSPRTNAQIREQLEELSPYLHHIGFTNRTEQDIRSELEALQQTDSPEIVLNMMRYMLGQFCHRRMFVFAWTGSHRKWGLLSRAYGILFSLFEWETMYLDGKGGKQKEPGKDLLIEPRSYQTLKEWLATAPAPNLVEELVGHFKCHDVPRSTSSKNSQLDAEQRLALLMEYWDSLFGEQE